MSPPPSDSMSVAARSDKLQRLSNRPIKVRKGLSPPNQPPMPPRWPRLQGLAALPSVLTLIFAAMIFFPPVRDNPNLQWSFGAIAVGLLVWQVVLFVAGRVRGRVFQVEIFPVKAHYVQGLVQFGILIWWGLYWPNVYSELPLIFAQGLFLYTVDALISWSRGRNWRLGFGPLPILVSTNLLLWFRHDWYIFQFLMLATGIMAKQFITWNRLGRRTHIFNPSAFGQFLFAIALIATGTSNDLTVGSDIAATFETPYMLLVIFLGGLIVQYYFHVTLMTLAAVAALCVLNLIYSSFTGLYWFVNINIAAPIFLGVHLLLTDPATSPRTNTGRVIFGVLYGCGYFLMFRLLDIFEVATFWDKLLPVPFLNLCVPLIDRGVRAGFVGRINGFWETAIRPTRMNLIHMLGWSGLFAAMLLTGFIASPFVDGPHPGNSIGFWKRAYADGKPFAGHSLVMVAGAQAEGGGSGAAFNELGLICMTGEIVNPNHAKAADYFAQACRLGDMNGCANVAIQYLFLRERLAAPQDMSKGVNDVQFALNKLEESCNQQPDWRTCYLVAAAYEMGRGRPWNKLRALELYERCGVDNLYACKGLARIALSGTDYPQLSRVVPALQWAAQQGDAESCWYLAYMYLQGKGVKPNEQKARLLLQQACQLGSQNACQALEQEVLPRYRAPIITVPPWFSAYPI